MRHARRLVDQTRRDTQSRHLEETHNTLRGMKRQPIVFGALLLVIWVGLPLIPHSTGLWFGMGHRLFFTTMLALSAIVFWLLGNDRIPYPRSVIGVLGSLVVVCLLTMGLVIAVIATYPQQGSPLQGQALPEVSWGTEAETRLQNVPPFLRDMVRRTTEGYAVRHGYLEITPEVMAEARESIGIR